MVFTNSSLRELLLQLVAIAVWQLLHSTHTVIARVRRTRGNLVIFGSSLRELLLQLVAISLWGTISFTECFYFCFIFILFCLQVINSFYFLFLYLLLVVYGLLRRFTPRNDEKRTVIAKAEGLWQSIIL